MKAMYFSTLAAAAAAFAGVASASYSCSNITLFKAPVETDIVYVYTAVEVPYNSSTGVPAYCDIQAKISSRINIWAKFPLNSSEWNGRFSQYGCGGGCGYNPFEDGTDPSSAITEGYAVSTTDMGNPMEGYQSYYNNLQGKIDWGYLATHLTAVASKMMIEAYYGSAPVYSYHIGGSTGGRQGLVEAQRFPGEFDGVVAVAPAYNETGITTYQITWLSQAAVANDSALTPLITANDTALIYAAHLAACDAADGLVDGIITSPRSCNFDISMLACGKITSSIANSSDCLSADALTAAKKMYSPPVNSKGINLTLEGLLPGSESNWVGSYIADPPGIGAEAGFYAFALQYLSYYAFNPDPAQPIAPVDFSMDTPITASSYIENFEYGGIADLSHFKQLGGKLIITQGLQDYAVAPWFASNYYKRVITAMGGRNVTDEFMRYYEMPGIGHVAGGPGADTWDELGVIAAWVENGTAPYAITAAHVDDDTGAVEFTRPMFPFPLQAYYNGTGDVTLASSFYPADTGGELIG